MREAFTKPVKVNHSPNIVIGKRFLATILHAFAVLKSASSAYGKYVEG